MVIEEHIPIVKPTRILTKIFQIIAFEFLIWGNKLETKNYYKGGEKWRT